MIEIPHKHEFDWDYEGWRKASLAANAYTQKDWNQTLLTRINQSSATIFKASLRGGANTIRCNENTFKIIKTLEYYYEDGVLSGRFKVIVDDLILDNVIYVYSSRIYEKPLLIPFSDNLKEIEGGDFDLDLVMREVSFKVESDENKKECRKYRKKLVAKINILNYENEKKGYDGEQLNSLKIPRKTK